MCQLPMVVKHFASEWKKWRTLVIVEEDILVLPCIELVRNPLVQVHEELIYIASTWYYYTGNTYLHIYSDKILCYEILTTSK